MKNELSKKYGLITAICMVVGIVIGSGVFFKATPVFANNGGDIKNITPKALFGNKEEL